MQKKAIAVYSPTNLVESTIQDVYYKTYSCWLPAYECQLLAKSLYSLKIFNEEWLEDTHLLQHRISYFFAPYMVRSRDTMVFVTHLLYLRDILENEEIDGLLHYPVTLMTTPLSHYLFKEYPVHIYIDFDKIKSANSQLKFCDFGGLSITEGNVTVPNDAILKVSDRTEEGEITFKAAAVEIDRGVFKIEEHERDLFPGDEVWDKKNSAAGVISEIEPGETGLIEITEENDKIVSITKPDFDSQFSQRMKV